jgi:hypothetical protein
VHRRAEPRPFALIWLAYILIASVVSIGSVGTLGLTAAEVYRPAARVLLSLVGVGICLVWPMIRLSQERPRSPLRAALGDAIVVVLPVLMLIMPQSLPWMAGWPWHISLAMALVLAGWSAIVAGVIGLTLLPSPTPALARSAGMLALVMLALVAPFVAAVLGTLPQTPWNAGQADGYEPGAASLLLVASPMTAPFELTRDRAWSGDVAMISQSHWWIVLTIWVVAALIWTLAALAVLGPRDQSSGLAKSAEDA